MNRRKATALLGSTFLTASLLQNVSFAQSSKVPLIKPKALKEGDYVSIIAPGSNVSDPDDIKKALEITQYFGLKPLLSNNLTHVAGRKVIPVSDRLHDLHDAFANSEVKAIFSIRGGYGCSQLLDKLDYRLIKDNPKIFIGYSDITAIHLAISKITGLVTFHGPVLLSKFTDFTVQNFKNMIFNNQTLELNNPKELSGIREKYPCRTIVEGKARGQLTGGNLSLISSLMGTNYEIDTNNKILFIEDVGEAPYRIDRMLTQLRLAGKFDKVKGIIIGKCEDCEGALSTWNYTLGEVLDNLLGDLKIPVQYGLMFGHTDDQLTIPYGIEADFDTNVCGIKLTEQPII